MNTGYQQSTIAFCVSKHGKMPLDIDGKLCSRTGKKQAILLLEGYENPDPAKYEVAGTFGWGESIGESATHQSNTEACPVEYPMPAYNKYPLESRYFRSEYEPNMGEGQNVYKKNWDYGTGETDEFTIVGSGGQNTGTYAVRRVGEYYWLLENWKMRYRTDRPYAGYVPTQEQLDSYDPPIPHTVYEHEQTNGIYAYSEHFPLNNIQIMSAFSSGEWEIPQPFGENLLNTKIVVNKVFNSDGSYTDDAGRISFPFQVNGNAPITISAKNQVAIRVYYTWSPPTTEGQNIRRQYWLGEEDGGEAAPDGKWQSSSNGNYYHQNWTDSGWLVVQFPEGWSYNDIEENEVKFQKGSTTEPVYSPPLPYEEDYLLDEYWRPPTATEYLQLFGMAGNLDVDEIFKCTFSSDTSEVPYDGTNLGDDILGVRLIASGTRHQSDFHYQFYGQMCIMHTLREVGDYSGDTGALVLFPEGYFGHKLFKDDNIEGMYPSGQSPSLKFRLRSLRLVMPLSDEELGYKLYIDRNKDKIQVLEHSEAKPANPSTIGLTASNELPKGLLRGLAVRWMDADKAQVLAPLSKLEAELLKVQNDSGKGWWGFIDQ